MGALLDWLGLNDPALRERVIIGLFGFVGVLVTGLIAILTWWGNQVVTRNAARRVRKEKTRDVQTALLAEIEAIYWQHAATERQFGGFDALRDVFRKRFDDARTAGSDYTPYVTAETGTVIFEALVEDISVLEHGEIRPVVQFYRQVALIEKFAEELKTDRFHALDLDRKQAMTLDYLRMVGTVVGLGDTARTVLAARLGVAVAESPADSGPNKVVADRSPPASPGPAVASQAGESPSQSS